MTRPPLDRVLFPCLALVAVALLAWSPSARAQQVFAGDPIDPATGAAYCIFPGRPLVYPGPDGRFGTADDLVDPKVTGDIDVVLRTGGRFGGGAIPGTASGIAAAPAVVAGGLHGRAGTLVPFQLIVTDGAASPVGGHPLLDSQFDLRRALIVAYADLDGDGFIGPTANADPTDDQIQRQEALTFAGRAMAEFHNGVASGGIGVSLGAPASGGGLGIVVGAGAATGATPNLYSDGPWIATSLPYMIPLVQSQIVGGEPTGPVDPVGLVDLELSPSAIYLPPPTHPLLGGVYAIPLDGSDASIDLLRSNSGAAVGAGFGVPIDRATFVARWGRVVRVALDDAGRRELIEDATAVSLPANGGAANLHLFPVDLLGNPTDPPSAGMPVALEASGGVRIVSPDGDGDPLREVIVFRSASSVPLVVDNGGVPQATGATGLLTAFVDGVPTGAVVLTIGTGGLPSPTLISTPVSTPVPTSATPPASTPTSQPVATPVSTPALPQSAAATMRHSRKPGHDEIRLGVTFAAATALDPLTQAVTVAVTGPSTPIYQRTFAPGSFQLGHTARRVVFKEKTTRIAIQRRARQAARVNLSLVALGLDLSSTPADIAGVEVAVTIGSEEFRAVLGCVANRAGTVTRCAP